MKGRARGPSENEEPASRSLQMTEGLGRRHTCITHQARAQHSLNSMGDTRDTENRCRVSPRLSGVAFTFCSKSSSRSNRKGASREDASLRYQVWVA